MTYKIMHQGRPIKIARTNPLIPDDFVGRLGPLKGSPSDGYSATVFDSNDVPIAQAVNYMTGEGWFIYVPQ